MLIRPNITISGLVREREESPFVKELHADLVRLAAEAFKVEFDGVGVAGVLAAECRELPDGRTRLVYDFDSEAELDDFQLGYLAELAHTPEGSWSQQNGKLLGRSFASLRRRASRCRY